MAQRYDIDEAAINATADVHCIIEGGVIRFLVRGGAYVQASIDADGLMVLLPEKSSSHARLVAALAGTDVGQAALARAAMSPDDRAKARVAAGLTTP